jgi:glycerol-3-phosphate dehydrogenase
VLLLEQGDLAGATSSASTKLIHGGLRYLEYREFRLVRESALERNLLLKNAPHYVKPLATVLPIRSVFGGIGPSILRFFRRPAKLNDRGAVITEIGLWLYDLYGRHCRGMPRHRFLTGKRLRQEMPELDKGIGSAGIYYEGRITHAERLGLELIRDGLAFNPNSAARNHLGVAGRGDGGAIRLHDRRTDATIEVEGDIVVNAGGAWIDKVNAALGINSRHMGGNKGAHLVVRNERLHAALDGRMVYFGTRDGRVNLLYPFMGNVLIGSTDVPIADPDQASCDEAELTYLLAVVAEVFPDIPLDRSQVVFTYWGVRPLPRADGLDPGAVSRDHHIALDRLPGGDAPVLSLIGGKWTTFRGFAEQAADDILRRLGRTRQVGTRDMPIGGGRDYPGDEQGRARFTGELAQATGITPERAVTLFDRYGTHARVVAKALDPAHDRPLDTLPDYSTGELCQLCRAEAVMTLADLLFRRTDIALSGRLSPAVIEETAGVAAEALGWDGARRTDEVARTMTEAQRHGVA